MDTLDEVLIKFRNFLKQLIITSVVSAWTKISLIQSLNLPKIKRYDYILIGYNKQEILFKIDIYIYVVFKFYLIIWILNEQFFKYTAHFPESKYQSK